MTEIDHENISIYTETLFALARDAWRQGRMEAFDFLMSYLRGLVPGNALDAFVGGLEPNRSKIRLVDSVRLDNSGGTLVTNPVPPPRLPPAPVFQPRESATLKW